AQAAPDPRHLVGSVEILSRRANAPGRAETDRRCAAIEAQPLDLLGKNDGSGRRLTGPAALTIEPVPGLLGRPLRILPVVESVARLRVAGQAEARARRWATTDSGVARGELGTVDPVLGKLLRRPPLTFVEVLVERAGRATSSSARPGRDVASHAVVPGRYRDQFSLKPRS